MTMINDTTIESIAARPFAEQTEWVEEAIACIRQKHQRGAESIMEVAEVFASAKQRFGSSTEYFKLFVRRTGMSASYASCMLKIDNWSKQTLKQFSAAYPDSRILELCEGWSTLYALTDFTLAQLADLNAKLESGKIDKLSRRTISQLLDKKNETENDVLLGRVLIDRDKLRSLDIPARRVVCAQLTMLLDNVNTLKAGGIAFKFKGKNASVTELLEAVVEDCCGVDDVHLAQAA